MRGTLMPKACTSDRVLGGGAQICAEPGALDDNQVARQITDRGDMTQTR